MNQLLEEIDKILYDFIQFLIDNYILYHDSIDNYHLSQRTIKVSKGYILFDIFYTYILYVLLTTVTLKHGLLLIYPNKLMWTPFKDCTMVFGNQAIIFHAFSFSFLLVTIIGKLVFLFYENKFEQTIFDIIVSIKAREGNYMLSQKHFHKIKFMTLKFISPVLWFHKNNRIHHSVYLQSYDHRSNYCHLSTL